MKQSLLNRLLGVVLLAILYAVCGEYDPRPALFEALGQVAAAFNRYKLLALPLLLSACMAQSYAQREASNEHPNPHATPSSK